MIERWIIQLLEAICDEQQTDDENEGNNCDSALAANILVPTENFFLGKNRHDWNEQLVFSDYESSDKREASQSTQ